MLSPPIADDEVHTSAEKTTPSDENLAPKQVDGEEEEHLMVKHREHVAATAVEEEEEREAAEAAAQEAKLQAELLAARRHKQSKENLEHLNRMLEQTAGFQIHFRIKSEAAVQVNQDRKQRREELREQRVQETGDSRKRHYGDEGMEAKPTTRQGRQSSSTSSATVAPPKAKRGRKPKQAVVVEEEETTGMPTMPSADDFEVIDETPALFTGGTLRDYQMLGLQWLNTLHVSMTNGILADEMGLGKTIQAIAMICHLYETRTVDTPILVTGPMSTLKNWQREFALFSPKVPVILYHGTKLEKVELRLGFGNNHEIEMDGATFKQSPVIICSYETIINDRAFLQPIHFQYFVLDEGHRIKNCKTVLHKTLSQMHFKHRLLMTGTPLQNNLQELWSLLNFLMPSMFKQVEWFLSYFDFNEVVDMENTVSVMSDGKGESIVGRKAKAAKNKSKALVAREEQTQMMSKLHDILSAFMLRRKKCDVKLDLPAKKEVLVYAPMAYQQSEWYRMAFDRTLASVTSQKSADFNRPVEGKRVRADVDYSLFDSDKIDKQWLAKELDIFDEQMLEFSAVARRNKRKAEEAARNLLPTPPGSSNENSNQSSTAANATASQSATETASAEEPVMGRGSKRGLPSPEEKPLNAIQQFERNLWRKGGFGSRMVLLREIAMHPYLIHCPIDKEGYIVSSERMVRESGKMRVLDQMLAKLKAQGHKVLIFSQYTMLLDILMAYAEMRGYDYRSLDGRMSLDDRDIQILEFNKNAEVFLMMISTRAGGLGLNLTAADTVILYDSDWNPQCDLQAQDRCHRIGQTKPVVVYRLVTKDTIDEKMIERAHDKRSLEKLIIKDGDFTTGLTEEAQTAKSKAKRLREADIELLLTTTAHESTMGMEKGVHEKDYLDEHTPAKPVFSEEQIDALLDRSDMLGYKTDYNIVKGEGEDKEKGEQKDEGEDKEKAEPKEKLFNLDLPTHK